MKLKWIKRMSVGAAIAVLTAFFVVGCGSTEKQNNGSLSTDSSQDISEVSTKQEVPEKSEVPKKSADELKREKVEQYLADMTTEEKVAQLFVITPEAITDVQTVTAAGNATRKALEKYPVGGMVYMKANLVSEDQTKKLLENTKTMYKEIADLPIFLTVDEEGGTVARIAGNDGFSIENVGSMNLIGESGDTDKAYEVGVTIGTYLSDLGFNVDFAPVADVLTNSENQIVAKRSFGSDSELVTNMVLAEMKGFEETGILSCVKHFPGHGCTIGDTHEGYAYTDKTREELQQEELVPFQEACANGVLFVMVAHISAPNVIGDNTPSSLSPVMITDILRNEWNYDGIVITDALNMGAIVQNYSSADAAVKALQAGADMLLMPENFQEAYQGVLDALENGTLTQEQIDCSVRRILNVKLSMQ